MILDIFTKEYEDTKKSTKNIYTGSGSPFSVLCGSAEDLLSSLEDNSVHAYIFDPPYGVNINKDWDGGLPPSTIWEECFRSLKPGGHLVFFGQPSKIPEIIALLGATPFDFRDMFIWCYQGTHPKGFKTDDGAFRSKIRNIYNPIFVYRKPLEGTEEENWVTYRTNLLNINDTRLGYKGDHSCIVRKYEETGKLHYQSESKSNTFGNLKRKGWVPDARGAIATNVVYCPRPTTEERTINGMVENTHETVKPVALMSFLVRLFTNSPEQLVVDPFCGSGTTGMACRKNNREFKGFDMDKLWVDVSKTRIENVFSLDEKHFNKLRQV